MNINHLIKVSNDSENKATLQIVTPKINGTPTKKQICLLIEDEERKQALPIFFTEFQLATLIENLQILKTELRCKNLLH